MVKYHPRLKLVHDYQARKHPLYTTWAQMRYRCEDPGNSSYAKYGGRGITVCKEWSESFESFALDMGFPPTTKHTLDRKNNNEGYSKDNCRWATRTEQCLNRRTFSNNTTGETGIVLLENGSFNARYDEEKKRYNLGRFTTLEQAIQYRNEFIRILPIDKGAALRMTERRARRDSATGVKGITKNKDGYLVRTTLSNGVRKYLGFSTSLEGAIEKLSTFAGSYK
jgi:hypothetical protein